MDIHVYDYWTRITNDITSDFRPDADQSQFSTTWSLIGIRNNAGYIGICSQHHTSFTAWADDIPHLVTNSAIKFLADDARPFMPAYQHGTYVATASFTYQVLFDQPLFKPGISQPRHGGSVLFRNYWFPDEGFTNIRRRDELFGVAFFWRLQNTPPTSPQGSKDIDIEPVALVFALPKSFTSTR